MAIQRVTPTDPLKTQIKTDPKNRQSKRPKTKITGQAHQSTVLRSLHLCQYCSEAYRQLLSAHGFLVSMSRKGNCWDNAVTESFFKTLKAELMWRQAWSTRQEVEQAITL
ncbi:DDE-type integrase/transposase/recombinase [Gluconobacter cerinus]|nr:DDE-type integrase/transposase/recombinase [Gluconobacter cerinus]